MDDCAALKQAVFQLQLAFDQHSLAPADKCIYVPISSFYFIYLFILLNMLRPLVHNYYVIAVEKTHDIFNCVA